jgi:hypothetical protein
MSGSRGHVRWPAWGSGCSPGGHVRSSRPGPGITANDWGFATYRASRDDYQDNYLPTRDTSGAAEAALDTACGLYLADPTAWT